MIDGFENKKVLQYRALDTTKVTADDPWTEWQDVPHAGLEKGAQL
jgi:hypothetical protein